MKYKTLIVLIILVSAVTLFFIDRNVWMKNRVLHVKVWEYEKGDVGYTMTDTIYRSLLYTDKIISFENNTLVFENRIGGILVQYDTLEMKWSYFGRMRIVDPKTKKSATYIIFNKR